MSTSAVTREGIKGAHPGREAMGRNQLRAAAQQVPPAEFRSYYGRPILKSPTWKPADITGYLFLGGLAGASSTLAAGAELTGRRLLAKNAKLGALGAVSLGVFALVHDLGRPERFVNMLRVMKPTSPMSVGSWLLTVYGPAAGAAAGTTLLGRFPLIGKIATFGAGLVGPAIATYTAVLVSDTATPAWHEGRREMPYIFAGSAAGAAGGLALLTTPTSLAGPAVNTAIGGAATEAIAVQLLKRRLGVVAETYKKGRAGALLRAADVLGTAGVAATLAGRFFGRRSRALSAVGGASLLASSACARLGIFEAGRASVLDPKYTVAPQRQRLSERTRI